MNARGKWVTITTPKVVQKSASERSEHHLVLRNARYCFVPDMTQKVASSKLGEKIGKANRSPFTAANGKKKNDAEQQETPWGHSGVTHLSKPVPMAVIKNAKQIRFRKSRGATDLKPTRNWRQPVRPEKKAPISDVVPQFDGGGLGYLSALALAFNLRPTPGKKKHRVGPG